MLVCARNVCRRNCVGVVIHHKVPLPFGRTAGCAEDRGIAICCRIYSCGVVGIDTVVADSLVGFKPGRC